MLLDDRLRQIVLKRRPYLKSYKDGSLDLLSKREADMVHCLYKGLSSKQIAEKFNISSRTVDKHFANILGKLGYKSRMQLMVDLLGQHQVSE